MRRLPNILVTGTPGVGKTSLCQNLQFMMSTKADPGSTAMLFDGLSGVLEDLSEQRGVEWSWGEYEDDEQNGCFESGKEMKYLSINDLVKERNFHESRDSERDCWVVDEDALLDHLEDTVPTQGGYIIDWHIPDIFPRSWIDLVVVLRADTAVLYDRLAARGYSESKLQENLDAEIMQVVLEDVKDAFEEEDDEDDSNPNAENGTSRDRDDEAIPGEQVDSALRRRRMVVVFPSNTDDDMERNLECLQMWIMARIALEREDRRSEGDKEEGVTP